VRNVRVQADGLFSDAFKAALQTAIERDPGASSIVSSGGMDAINSSGYSRSQSGYRGPTPQSHGDTAGPLIQILATALGQSRATLERLQAEEAEIENLIQQERKQVERLEWLLQKIQGDYAYFNNLQKRFEDDSSRDSRASSSSSGYDNSSAYGGSSSGYDNSSSSSSGYGGYDSSSSTSGYDRSTSNGSSSSSSSTGSRFANYY
jgi:hypothetical protein